MSAAGRRTAALLAVCAAWSAAARGAEPLRVSAAASLQPALREALARFPAPEGGRPLLNSAASAILLQQARRGAPVDVLLSASPEEIDRLLDERLARADTRRDLASNRLVAVTACGAGAPGVFDDLRQARYDRIAVGNPRTAPLGRYTAQALAAAGLAAELAPRLVLGESARQVLDYVDRREAPVGLVYRSDALLLPGRICVAFDIAPDLYETVRYQGIVLRGAARPAAALALLDWLGSEAGRAVFAAFGFLPPAPE